MTLPLGCSTGYFTSYLHKKCATVVALDSDASSINACRDRGIPAYLRDISSPDIIRFLADQPPFDLVVAMDVLEHLARPQELLVRLHQIIALVYPRGLEEVARR
jgi:2-polyprenyl-3-methyl-5-hydroxy-6-metoxy-1,4-benzoquinol methylase